MNRSVAILGLLIAPTTPLVSFAKGDLVRIEISGATLSSPLVVADPKILRQLFIWSGPGAGQPIGSPQSVDSGSFIDWHEGITAHVPDGMTSYNVSFFCVFDTKEPGGRLTYAVKYAYYAAEQLGYIYLPGPSEKNYGLNVSTVVHDVEGHWFKASPRWETLVSPLIRERASRSAGGVAARL